MWRIYSNPDPHGENGPLGEILSLTVSNGVSQKKFTTEVIM
jgi:hypothetical protein